MSKRRQLPERLVAVNVYDGLGSYAVQAVADDDITKVMQRTGRPYEWRLLRAVESLLIPGKLVVDVGANIGNHSLFFARRGCSVLAFEPNPEVIGILELNSAIPMRGAIVIRSEALGNMSGRGRLTTPYAGNLGGTAVVEHASGPVSVVCLDDVPGASGLGLLKIDVEGGELAVLEGARELLKAFRPDILLEVSEANRGAVSSVLAPLGYQRLPISLAAAPTFLYSTSRATLVRVLATGRPILERMSTWKAGRIRSGR